MAWAQHDRGAEDRPTMQFALPSRGSAEDDCLYDTRRSRGYTRLMKSILLAGLVVASGAALAAQEREVPKDSTLVTIRGCAKDRTFIVGPRSEEQPGTLEIEPGRRFRLNGQKKMLDDLKKRQHHVIEVTGLIRKADVAPQGIAVLGGRVRIGADQPGTAARRRDYVHRRRHDLHGEGRRQHDPRNGQRQPVHRHQEIVATDKA